MTEARTALALPIDVARLFDATVLNAQIAQSTFINSDDDEDLLFGMIEDAEEEFHSRTDRSFRVSSVGQEGLRESYEVVTYDISGHKRFKANYTGVRSNYLPEEVDTDLKQTRVLPFDSDAGDAVYVYRGMRGQATAGGTTWEDITAEEAESWLITDYRNGRITFDPSLLFETRSRQTQGISLTEGSLPELKVAIRYRYGAQAGSRSNYTETDLSGALDASTTSGAVPVADGTQFPTAGNQIIVKIGSEYLSVVPDPSNDQMEILERGVRGTTATSHADGDAVTYTPPSVRKAVASRAGMALVQSRHYRGWLPDTEDDVSMDDIYDSFESTWSTTIQALGASADE